MKTALANGITIEYEESGKPGNPVIMLIRGLGSQLIEWPKELIDGLVDQGFRVVYHDNRDVGLSTKLDELGVPDIAAAITKKNRGEPIIPPYTLDDMALDVIGLQDALGITAAHIVGISMGGGIAQKLAANHAKRVKSMVLVMSGSSNPDLPAPKPEAMAAVTGMLTISDDRESVISHGAEAMRIIGGSGYPQSEESRRKHFIARYDRSHHPAGMARQMMAVLAETSRVELQKTIKVPTLVIHGSDDPLAPVEAGKDTAANIPNARLEIIEGMGHIIPVPLVPKIVEFIAGHAKSHP